MTDRERIEQFLGNLTDAGARLALEVLVSQNPGVMDETDLRQSFFLASYVENRGHIGKSLKACGLSWRTYRKWCTDAGFQAKLVLADESDWHEVWRVVVEKAKGGDMEAAKFVLPVMYPDRFDGKVRLQKLINQGQRDQLSREASELSEADWEAAKESDPILTTH